MFGIRRCTGWSCGGANIFNVRLGGVVLGFVPFGSSGIGESILLVVVNGGESAEEEAVDISQNGGAARRYAIGGKKAIDIGEGEVDALGGLKILGPGEQIVGQVGDLFFFLGSKVTGTELRLRVDGELTALTA